jgi:membrane protease YdiL (CAAX protease family)
MFAVSGAQKLAVHYGKIPLERGIESFEPHQLAILMLASSLATLASSFAAIALVQLRAGATSKDVGLVARDFLHDVKLGAAAFVMLAPPMYLLQIGLTQVWKYEHPVQDLLEQQTDLSMLAVTLITAVGVAPFAEEIFFRVIFQGWLENVSAAGRKTFRLTPANHFATDDELLHDWRSTMIGDRAGIAFLEPIATVSEASVDPSEIAVAREAPATIVDDGNPYRAPRTDTMSPRMDDPVKAEEKPAVPVKHFLPGYLPIFVSALIFAMMHFGQGPAPIPLFFLAIGLGYLYRQTHRATPSIVVHLLINSLSMAALWFSLLFKE